MGKEKLQRKLTFREAVEATPDVATGYQEGVNAFGKYADKIKVPEPEKIDGSLDIDATTVKLLSMAVPSISARRQAREPMAYMWVPLRKP